jgi:hypothetical protein
MQITSTIASLSVALLSETPIPIEEEVVDPNSPHWRKFAPASFALQVHVGRAEKPVTAKVYEPVDPRVTEETQDPVWETIVQGLLVQLVDAPALPAKVIRSKRSGPLELLVTDPISTGAGDD